MGCGGDLTEPEKATIISELVRKNYFKNICKKIGKSHGRVKKFMAAPDAIRTMADRGSLWSVYHRTLSRIK